jgi:hypothetical protein
MTKDPIKDYYEHALKTFEGRQLLWDLLEKTGYFDVAGPGNSLEAAYLNGKRSIGKYIFDYILTSGVGQIINMMHEASRGDKHE